MCERATSRVVIRGRGLICIHRRVGGESLRPKVRFETAAYYNSKEDHRAVTGCCNEDNELWARGSAEAHSNLAQSLLDMVLVQRRLKVHIVRFELWFALFKFIH